MRKVHFIQADVFTDSPFGGNPVVVVPDSRGMTSDEMQSLARGMSFAETAFVVKPTRVEAAVALRCFTPTTEVAYSGHQLMGAVFVLVSAGRLRLDGGTTEVKVQIGDEIVPVFLTRGLQGEILRVSTQDQPARFRDQTDDFSTVAAALSTDPMEILHTGLPIQVVQTGLACLIVPVRSLTAVRGILPMRQTLDRLLQDAGAACALVYTTETLSLRNDVHVRVFAPPLGIAEDPATGSANGALAAYLWHHGVKTQPQGRLRCEQGSEMGRPSVVEIEVDAAAEPMAILVGGRVARSVEGSVFF